MAEPKNSINRKVGRGKKQSWEAKELSDIKNNWKPGWSSKEGKRKAAIRKS